MLFLCYVQFSIEGAQLNLLTDSQTAFWRMEIIKNCKQQLTVLEFASACLFTKHQQLFMMGGSALIHIFLVGEEADSFGFSGFF